MGKQDMPLEYAKQMTEMHDATEEEIRKDWDEQVFDILINIRTKLTQSDSEIFPLKCPKCDSYKITVVFGTSRRLECLSCKSQFKIDDQ
jgi:hypothetical protein